MIDEEDSALVPASLLEGKLFSKHTAVRRSCSSRGEVTQDHGGQSLYCGAGCCWLGSIKSWGRFLASKHQVKNEKEVGLGNIYSSVRIWNNSDDQLGHVLMIYTRFIPDGLKVPTSECPWMHLESISCFRFITCQHLHFSRLIKRSKCLWKWFFISYLFIIYLLELSV